MINPLLIEDAVLAALNEDLGRAGDITSQATIPASAMATAVIASRQVGVIAGMAFAQTAFTMMDPNLEFEILVGDGEHVSAGAEAVYMVAGKMKCEASGNVNLSTVRAIAETGVDIISSGALTHSAPVLDLGLDIKIR